MSAIRATYRLQLTPELDFAAVAELVPYLRDLGVSHLYLSPALRAREGSTHGYDVVDPTEVSPALGGEEGLRALAGLGLGIILDIVPNHMGVSEENRWWADEDERPRVFDVDEETGFVRRFFDIDDLAALRMEREEVFDLVHGKVLQLLAEGVLDGLRVDHPDGLADPAGYLQRLRAAGAEHVWVEKILSSHSRPPEPLRDWPVDGTVGYEFLNDALGLYVDPAAEAALSALWFELSGDTRRFEEVALEAQLEQARGTFHREVTWLARVSGDRFSPAELEQALALMPVYRTYVEPWSGRVEDEDRARIAEAGLGEELARVLLLEDDSADPLDEFVTRFQQTSPPVTAKGIEDTAFYRYFRLLALNEVGGDPGCFGVSVAAFHAANAERAARTPGGLLVTQTHDTKRSGDSRARITAITRAPQAWEALVRALVEPGHAVGLAEQYLVLQTLVGVGTDVTRERLDGFLEKALREGKRTSTWAQPDEAHERAVKDWAWARARDERLAVFCEQIAAEAERSALGQTLLKLTVPGVPDVYQGDEGWMHAMVDPDNRRPVDWGARRAALDAARAGAAPTRETAKLHLIHRALELRARRPDAFASGDYVALDAGEDVCAFARGGEVVVVAPIRPGDDDVLTVPEVLRGGWSSVLDGGSVELTASTAVAPLLTAPYGAALLERPR